MSGNRSIMEMDFRFKIFMIKKGTGRRAKPIGNNKFRPMIRDGIITGTK